MNENKPYYKNVTNQTRPVGTIHDYESDCNSESESIP